MNSIIKSNSTFKVLEKYGVLPESWDIPDEEKQRIKHSNVGILSITSPAGMLSVREGNPIDQVGHLITVNVSLLENKTISGRQLVAIMLHELGHIFNLPKPRTDSDLYVYQMKRSEPETPVPCDGEVYADDYARHCGYGDDFADALSIMKDLGEYGFDKPAIQTRIDRLRNSEEELLLNLK